MINNSYTTNTSNKLMRQFYKLNPNEARLVQYLLTKINGEDEDFKVYSLKISDFLSMIGSDSEPPKITRGLMQKGFSVINDKGNLLQVNWLSSAYYRQKEGVVELRFSPRLKPYLLRLKENLPSLM